MNDKREHVKRALWYLEREPMPLRDPVAEAERRNRIANAVDFRVRVIAEEKRSRASSLRFAALACAAAVAFVLGVVWLRNAGHAAPGPSPSPLALRLEGPVTVVHGGQSLLVFGADPVRLSPSDEIRTAPAARARAVLASGAVVDVAPSTSVRLEATPSSFEGSEELGLESGSIVLKVPKLGAHRRLSIHTPDATVTVRGTEFRVDVRQRDGHSTTAVTVLEGSVWVTKAGREITLEKGSNWSSEAAGEPPAASAAAADRAATGVAPPSTGGSVVSAVAPHAPGAASGREDAKSTLGAENDQYQRGVSAARGGDDNKAVSAFNMFLVRYPTSPLAQSAEVERFRALKRLGSVDEAARRARQYLAEYPAGFARVEAQNLAVQSLNPSGGP